MVRRIQSCIGFDEENLTFLQKRKDLTGESAADFLNKLLDKYREEEAKTIQQAGTLMSDGVAALVAKSNQRKFADDEKSIRDFLKENDYILYAAKAQKNIGKAALCKIMNELYFSKYGVQTTVEFIKPILRDEIERFDVEAYKKRKGILDNARK